MIFILSIMALLGLFSFYIIITELWYQFTRERNYEVEKRDPYGEDGWINVCADSLDYGYEKEDL